MIDKIVIHCSATPNGREDTAEDIHGWHLSNGWDGIGYHYVIECKGKLVHGRPEYWKGSHAYGHNTGSIGICMIGTDVFNSQQWYILENLIRELSIKYPGVEIMGHNEVSSKTCPGFDVQKWLIEIGL
jgi:N-acetylmuramoyl-L-alanine amidase